MELRVFLQQYKQMHDKARAAWQRTDYKAIPAGARSVAVYHCKHGGGGLADQLKGLLSVFLLTLLADKPRPLFIDCSIVVPLPNAWLPNYEWIDWTLPAPLERLRQIAQEQYPNSYYDETSEASYQTMGYRDLPERATSAVTKFFAAPEDVVFVNGNLIGGRMYTADLLPARPADWRRLVHRDEYLYKSRLPPELAAWLPAAPASEGGVQVPPRTDDRCAGIPLLPPAMQLTEGAGAPNINLVYQLLDVLVAPSQRLVQRVNEVSKWFDPGHQYVISIHVRVGTPNANAGYTDPARDSADKAAPLAAKCADQAVLDLYEKYGPRKSVLWYVSSDNDVAKELLRNAAKGRRVRGMHVDLVEMPLQKIMHLDKTNNTAFDTEELKQGFVDTYVEHFLLSAAHGMVRSRSGFSETAQAWGRVATAYQLDVPTDSCTDVREKLIQSFT